MGLLKKSKNKDIYLHAGENVVINCNEIVGIFDLDNTTVSSVSRKYLSRKEKEGRVINVSEKLPKSFVVCDGIDGESVYICQISPATLSKRNLIS